MRSDRIEFITARLAWKAIFGGEWGMGNGEWGMGNGEWGMGNGDWGLGTGEAEGNNPMPNAH